MSALEITLTGVLRSPDLAGARSAMYKVYQGESMSKFQNIPVEKDTKIIFQQEATLGQYEVFYQKWFWDGITAESIIFANEDVSELDDSEIEAEVRTSPLISQDSKITITRSESGYTFVNFNFETEEE